MSVRVLIADDHPLVRDGLRFIIERSGGSIEVVAEAADGLAVLEQAQHTPVDVFILDITMPRLNGLDTARELVKGNPAARVILLSIHDTRTFVEAALEAGARGYLVKDSASRHVVEAVREVHAGHYFLSPGITHFLVEKPGRRAGTRGGGRGAATLTGQERKVLQLVAEGRTTKEIASALRRSVNTVQTHRKHLMTKLGIHKDTDLVRFAIREGIAKL